MRTNTLPRRLMLKRSACFQRVYRAGRSYANRYLVLYVFHLHEGDPKPLYGEVGFAAGKKLGCAVRRSRVKRLLRETDLRISEIAARCGYRDANYLKNLFKKRTGMSMREWRAQSAQQEVIKKQLQRITGG